MKIGIINQATLRNFSLVYYKTQIPVKYMNELTTFKTEEYSCNLCSWEMGALRLKV